MEVIDLRGRKALVVGTVCLTYGTIATGLYALIRLAL